MVVEIKVYYYKISEQIMIMKYNFKVINKKFVDYNGVQMNNY